MDVVENLVTRKKKKYRDYPDKFSSKTHDLVLDRERAALRLVERASGWSCEYKRRRNQMYVMIVIVADKRVNAPIIRTSLLQALERANFRPTSRWRAVRWLDMAWKRSNRLVAAASRANGFKRKNPPN